MDGVVPSIIKAREIIRKKFNTFRRGEAETGEALEKIFKPIVTPLNAVLTSKGKTGEPTISHAESPVKKEDSAVNKSEEDGDDDDDVVGEATREDEEFDRTQEDEENKPTTEEAFTNRLDTTDFVDEYGPVVGSFIEDLRLHPKRYDSIYGVRLTSDGNLMVGARQVSFDNRGNLQVDGEVFRQSPGFLQLLFLKEPRDYTKRDEKKYKRLLAKTYALHPSYDSSRPPRASRSKKYQQVIKKIYPPATRVRKTGKGVFVEAPERVAWVHWNDPNELVNRLEILVASRRAGHSGHTREILSIEEELREEGYIL